jgi:signal transduction histidine kinase
MTRGTSFGLLSMKERPLMLGGALDATSGPGAGTTLSARAARGAPEVSGPSEP